MASQSWKHCIYNINLHKNIRDHFYGELWRIHERSNGYSVQFGNGLTCFLIQNMIASFGRIYIMNKKKKSLGHPTMFVVKTRDISAYLQEAKQ